MIVYSWLETPAWGLVKRRVRRWQSPRAAMGISACGVGNPRRRNFSLSQPAENKPVRKADLFAIGNRHSLFGMHDNFPLVNRDSLEPFLIFLYGHLAFSEKVVTLCRDL